MEIFWVEDGKNIAASITRFQFVCVCRVTPARDTLSVGVQNGDGTPNHTTNVFAAVRETELPVWALKLRNVEHARNSILTPTWVD